MNIEQFCAFVELLPEIEKTLKAKGEKVPRPQYGGKSIEDTNDTEDVELQDEEELMEERKANIEATSDEDEGD